MQETYVGPKDLAEDLALNGATNSASNSASPTPHRGFESHSDDFANPTEASRKGNAQRPFMGHSGPVAGDSGIDRGQFSARNVKQGPVG